MGKVTTGYYVVGKVTAHDRKSDLYTVEYESGPYEPESKHIEERTVLFPEGCVIESCMRFWLDAEEASSHHFPWCMLVISIIQVACFAYWAPREDAAVTMHTPTAGPDYMWFRMIRSFPNCNDDRLRYWWMPLSYQFVHSGLEHIVFNVFLQLLFGIPLELVQGPVVFLIYQTGVLCGALAVSFSDPYNSVVGASGGVYCLFGVHMAHLVLNWTDMKRALIGRYLRLVVLLIFFTSESLTWWLTKTAGKSFGNS